MSRVSSGLMINGLLEVVVEGQRRGGGTPAKGLPGNSVEECARKKDSFVRTVL